MQYARTFGASVLVALCGLAVALEVDPAKALDELEKSRETFMRSANGRNVAEFNKFTEQLKAKATGYLQEVDPDKAPAAQCLEWAQIAQIAQNREWATKLAIRFLDEAKPDGEKRSTAEIMALGGLSQMGKGDEVFARGMTASPATPAQAVQYLTMASYQWTAAVEEKRGAADALALMEYIGSKMDFAAFTGERAQQGHMARVQLAERKAELLVALGKRQEAAAALDATLALLPADSPLRRNVSSSKARTALIGAPAPSVTVERQHGEFAGLDSLRGKVVLLDFFAHWCGPCIRSFPDLAKMQSDLGPKGLQIVGVTRMYGYYQRENAEKRDMAPDVEYEKLKGFMADHRMAWPVVYSPKSDYDAYGVTGIPHVAVIDKKGNVRRIKIGYSPESFPKFREFVESLLSE